MSEEIVAGCPFCGEPPTVKKLQGCGNKHLFACKTATCPVAPTVMGATRADAIRRWNTRATKTQLARSDALLAALKSYRCQYTHDQDGGGLDLVDALSPGDTIKEGLCELELLAEHLDLALDEEKKAL